MCVYSASVCIICVYRGNDRRLAQWRLARNKCLVGKLSCHVKSEPMFVKIHAGLSDSAGARLAVSDMTENVAC